jgi:glycosyltransferase involved in cell wall biosynthesis
LTIYGEVVDLILRAEEPVALTMKIALVIISDGWGGAETVVYELAKHLAEKGHSVSLLVNNEALSFYRTLTNVHIFDLGHLYPFSSLCKSMGARHDTIGNLMLSLSRNADELYRDIRYWTIRRYLTTLIIRTKVQVINAHLRNAILLVSDLPQDIAARVATVHGEHMFIGRWRGSVVSRFLYKRREFRFKHALMNLEKITAVSTFISNVLSEWEPSLLKKIIVIRNGVNVVEIRRTSRPIKLKGECNLLFPGGAKPAKGGTIVIQALVEVKKHFPLLHLYFAGDVPGEHPLRRMTIRMHLESNVTFTGFLPTKKYRNLLESVDTLVMPSHEEAGSLVYLEAMALGKPIIAGRTGGVQEYVLHDRNGILVDLNTHAVAVAILALCRNGALARRISQSNLHDVQRFDWNLVVDEYVGLYYRLAGTSCHDDID